LLFFTESALLKEQVNTWIEEEIKFLQAESTISLPTKAAMEDEDKIQTSLSVSKLALLVRLMVIDKVITNRVVAQVLRVGHKNSGNDSSRKHWL
jgi:hypothetical protein